MSENNSQEIIARALCLQADIDPDAASESGEPNIFHMRVHALAIEVALLNAGVTLERYEDIRAEERERCAKAIPTNWLDPMLTGPTAALKGNGGTWGCPDIERLLKAIGTAIRNLP